MQEKMWSASQGGAGAGSSVKWLLPLLWFAGMPLLSLSTTPESTSSVDPDEVKLVMNGGDLESTNLDLASTMRVLESTASATATAESSLEPWTAPGPSALLDMANLDPVTASIAPSLSKVPRSVPYTMAPPLQSAGQFAACAPGATCAPLSYCRTVTDLLDRTCLAGDKLRRITCGTRAGETMVCCPAGGFSPIFPPSASVAPSFVPSPSSAPQLTTPSPFPATCGTPQVFNWRSGYTGIGAQPWVARVGFKSVETGAMDYPCCGSIINERVVLTAAHCALAKAAGHKLSSVRVGEYDSSVDPDCTSSYCALSVQDIAVDHVVVHPEYERSTFRHDVALLVLKSPITFSVGVQPICIDSGVGVPVVGSRAKLVGWGLTAGQSVVPAVQQTLDLPVSPLSTCAQVYNRVVPITSDQLCVGGEQGRDACSGFGGAPLVMLDLTTNRYYQVAIVSFGSNRCGLAGVPSVYTRVDHYVQWIRANMVQ